jgi:5-methylthioadenosine/S-adenosylhomocysteine deaminase
MFEEVRLAALLAKTASNDPTTVPAREALLMATRRGADALFIGDITGSLETGKRADLIAVDLNTLHNLPHFQRDPNAIYAQIVYAAHSADVRHVMCDGRLLMRDRVLLTVDEPQLIEQAATYAREVDAFLALREESLLSKLVAISDLERAESFEVQVKAEIESATVVDRLLRHPSVRIVKHVHYRQYDTYFLFDDAREGRVRYREDDQIDDDGDVQSVRARLTLTMPTVERKFHGSIVLSRSQFMADANRPLRFYREYFRPLSERELEKDRLRWHIDYRGERFYVNLDRVLRPAVDGLFIEIKSRTWSLQDAEQKAEFIREMMAILGVSTDATLVEGYLELQPETE